MLIESAIQFGDKVHVDDLVHKIPVEQMVRSMGMIDLISVKGCPITRIALTGLNEHWWKHMKYWTIDSRVHMLMKDWYPCIPGWHHDDVPRTRYDSQPNYDDPIRCEHAIFLLNAHVAPTEFAVGAIDLDHLEDGTLYEKWHKDVQFAVDGGKMDVVQCPDSQWLYFDDRSFHQGVKCQVEFGHRLFIRVAMNYILVDGVRQYIQPEKRANEIRRNAQVYMEYPNKGW